MDDRAFERLFRDHYGALCAFALRCVRELSLAEELVQDMFADLWARRGTWDPRAGSERAYLLTAIRNCARQRSRADRGAHRAAGGRPAAHRPRRLVVPADEQQVALERRVALALGMAIYATARGSRHATQHADGVSARRP